MRSGDWDPVRGRQGLKHTGDCLEMVMRDTEAHFVEWSVHHSLLRHDLIHVVCSVYSKQLCLFSDLKPELMGNFVTKDCKTVKSKNAM